MERTLTDADVDAVATRIIQLLGARLSAQEKRPELPTPVPSLPEMPEPKLAYTLKELAAILGVSKVTIWRLEARGLIRSLPYLRTKVYSRAEVERFLRGTEGQSEKHRTAGGRL
jgi:hypothetical protein